MPFCTIPLGVGLSLKSFKPLTSLKYSIETLLLQANIAMKNTKQISKELAGGKQRVKYSQPTKTRICKWYHRPGPDGILRQCAYGDKCNFVHEPSDWRQVRSGPCPTGPAFGETWTGFAPNEMAEEVGFAPPESPNTPMLGR